MMCAATVQAAGKSPVIEEAAIARERAPSRVDSTKEFEGEPHGARQPHLKDPMADSSARSDAHWYAISLSLNG